MTSAEVYNKKLLIDNEELIQYLVSQTQEIKLQKKEVLFAQDQNDEYLCFLKTSVFTSTEVFPNGKTICLAICSEPGSILVGGLGPKNTYSPVNVTAQIYSEVFRISLLQVRNITNEYPDIIKNTYIMLLLQEYEKQWETKKMLYLDSPDARYEWFLKHYPGIISIINHDIIASFLHMSPVTLSRVRHRKSFY